MDKTRIEWADMTWNPVTGCRHGCEYCYARRIARRFGGLLGFENGKGAEQGGGENHELREQARDLVKRSAAPFPYYFDPTFHRYRLEEPGKKRRPRNIFVCSMADLFGAWVPLTWIRDVFDACVAAPQHNYLFLTKNPGRYRDLDRMALLPRWRNFWYGATATNGKEGWDAVEAFQYLNREVNTFLSVEPMAEDIAESLWWDEMLDLEYPLVDWVILGKETGNRRDRVEPKKEWIDKVILDCGLAGVPLFMKDNLVGSWVGAIARELPVGLEKGDHKK